MKGGANPRVSSPEPGFSILTTSAPRSASICTQVGPASTRVRSNTLTPLSGPVGSVMGHLFADRISNRNGAGRRTPRRDGGAGGAEHRPGSGGRNATKFYRSLSFAKCNDHFMLSGFGTCDRGTYQDLEYQDLYNQDLSEQAPCMWGL